MSEQNSSASAPAGEVQTVARPAAPAPRAPALRATALGRAMKWAHEVVVVEGESYLVREPSVAQQRRIVACMPEQKFKGTQDDEGAREADFEATVRPEIMLNMRIERLIQCTHDMHGQRIFSDADREEIEKWPAEDELLEAVNAAVDRLTKKAGAAGKS